MHAARSPPKPARAATGLSTMKVLPHSAWFSPTMSRFMAATVLAKTSSLLAKNA